jgi:hypothetical protein
VILKNTSGSIRVKGHSSPVGISHIKKLPLDGEIDVQTTYKDIRLILPASAKVVISAYSKYGKIESDYPIFVLKGGGQDSTHRQEGKTFVQLKTSRKIVIKKK